MIRSFYDKDLERFWLSKGTIHVKCIPSELRQATYRKLRELNQAKDSRDLRNTPSNHFEKLEGKWHFGYSSIRINKQYRYEQLKDVTYLAEGGFGKVYKAKWPAGNDGNPITKWNENKNKVIEKILSNEKNLRKTINKNLIEINIKWWGIKAL